MPLWVWLIAYVAGFALIQLVLYRYLGDSTGGGSPAGGGDGRSRYEHAAAESAGTEGGNHCQHCGARNKTGYRYCKGCAAQL